LKISIFT